MSVPRSRYSREAWRIKKADDPTQAYLDRVRKRLEKLDAINLITGPEGYTKSTCARHLAHITDQDFQPEKQIAYTDREYLKLIRDMPPGSAIVPDEGVEMFHNRNSMTKSAKIVNEVLMECRIMHLAHFICFPRMDSVDIYLRDFRVWSWIRCLAPGVAEVRVRNWEIPVGETEHDAKQAYPPVCGLTYPAIESESWEQNEKRKIDHIENKITEYLEA